MNIQELRTEREKLEAEILKLCEDFKTRTGLCVVSIGTETGSTCRFESPYRETYLLGVRVGTEQI